MGFAECLQTFEGSCADPVVDIVPVDFLGSKSLLEPYRPDFVACTVHVNQTFPFMERYGLLAHRHSLWVNEVEPLLTPFEVEHMLNLRERV